MLLPGSVRTTYGQSDDATPSRLIDLPEDGGSFPAILLAPGAAFHMTMPLFERLVTAANDQGIAVVRFNWSKAMRNESFNFEDLSEETSDLEEALNATKANPAIDAGRIVLIGKSLGTLVGYAKFAETPEMIGAVLLTPICQDPGSLQANYAGLENEQRPMALVLGDVDPLCPAEKFAIETSDLPDNIDATLVAGDHAFIVNHDVEGDFMEKANDADNLTNANIVVKLTIDAVRHMLSVDAP
jgi:dienelactone hydrolase